MEETRSARKRTFEGKSTILFLLHLFLRVFVILLCPVALVFTFQKKLIMNGEWALNFKEFIVIGILFIVGGSLIFSLMCLIVAPFSVLVIEGSKVIFRRRFSKKETSLNFSGGKDDTGRNRDVSVSVKRKRNFLGESIVLRSGYRDVALWEASFPSSVWKEISIYLLGFSLELPKDYKTKMKKEDKQI